MVILLVDRQTDSPSLSQNLPVRSSLSPFYRPLFQLAGFIGAKDDGDGGDNWRCKTCYGPVKLSPPTNQHPTFYRSDALPVTQPTMSKH